MTDDPRKRWAQCTGFQWDAGNDTKNGERHEVTGAEAEQVFFSIPFLVAADVAHSQTEERFYGLGQTADGRLLFVVWTLRGAFIRVISARAMSRNEQRIYADAQAQTDS